MNMTIVPIVDGPRQRSGLSGEVRSRLRHGPAVPGINGFPVQPPVGRGPQPAPRPHGRHRDRNRYGPAAHTPAPALARVGDACQGSEVAFKEALGGIAVRLGSVTLAALIEHDVDRGAVDALHPQLLADRAFPTRPCPVT
jgi:hypothetical protein